MEKVTAEDYYDLNRVTSIESTDRYVVWDEKKPDRIENSYTSCLKLLDKETGKIKQFTAGTKLDHFPKFSPNGEKLAFLSTRAEKPQIFVMNLDGGEALKLSSAMNGVQGFDWSPDGKHIAYTSLVDPDEVEEEEPPKSKFEAERRRAEKEEEERKVSDPKVITRLVYRQGTSYLHPNRYAHVFVVNVETKEEKRISDGDFHHSIPKFVSNSEVVVTSKREEPIDLSDQVSLVKFSIDDVSEGDIMTTFRSYWTAPPIADEHGRVYVNLLGEGTPAGQNSKWGRLKGNAIEIINSDLDRSVETVKFVDDNTVFVSVADTGTVDIRHYNTETEQFDKLFDTQQSVVDFTAISKDEIYFTATSALKVWAVYKWTRENGVELVDDPNAEGLSAKSLVDAEEMWFTSPNGVKFQGWFFDASKVRDDNEKPPLVLSIHGGPHVMWTNAGTMMHEWQTTVNAGYSVLALNPIGSLGYGQDFSQEIVPAQWGHEDARDLLNAVDTIIDRVDPDRLYVTGGSYAGFQTANIISRDHRFKAAVAQRGVYNFINFGFVTDIPLWFEWEMDGTPYEKLNQLWEDSPLGRAKEIETPLLIIHAENDFRVPISEAESLYAALKLQDKEVVFVRYPRDGHELSRSGEPDHVVDRIERMIQWFDSHP